MREKRRVWGTRLGRLDSIDVHQGSPGQRCTGGENEEGGEKGEREKKWRKRGREWRGRDRKEEGLVWPIAGSG